MPKILVVDDELSIRESFSLILEGKYDILQAASGEAALKLAADQRLDLVFLDIRMPGLDGLETLEMLKKIDPDLEIIMVTAVNDVQKASQAVKLGARDYIVKPFDVNNVLKLSEQVLRRKSILSEGSEIQRKTGKRAPELIGQSEQILSILKTIDRIKPEERVLISGEPGTERTLVAQVIHERSESADLPFRAIHLSRQISALEIKCLLFGREKGASTADLEGRIGLFEEVKNGSLFIDNLESLPEEIFRIISALHFSRVGPGSQAREAGASTKIPIETRMIGGTSNDLGKMNKDLLEFFSTNQIQLPPLRERSSDIPILANHFMERFNEQYGRDAKISAEVLDTLASYSWPGNTQELQSLLERLVLSCASDQINLEDLPLDILLQTTEGGGSTFLSTFESEYVRGAFEKKGKNKERTAAFLGINPVLLETKL